MAQRLWVMVGFQLMVVAGCAAQDQPSAEQFKLALDAQLQKLTPDGFTERTVLFQEVRPGSPNGGYYPFRVTAHIHDYAPGYPPNNYYGQSCVSRIDGWTFDMLPDDFGGWTVQGRMTGGDSVCTDNPSEGVTAIPLAGLPGTPVERPTNGATANGRTGDGATAAAPPGAAQPAAPRSDALYLGEYACYGTGGRLLAGMGFLLQRGGRYQDTDGERGGSYTHDAGAATLSFHGGFLDGQVGRNVRGTGFDLSSTVACEPWR